MASTKGAIVITSWICTTLIIALILWITQLQWGFWGTLFFILILYAIPFVLSIILYEAKET